MNRSMAAEGGLRRELGLLQMTALVAGAVIGGWLVELPYWFQITGAGAGIIFIPLALILIPVGLAIAELMSMIPYTAGFYLFTAAALGQNAGFWTQWIFFYTQVLEVPFMAFIFAVVVNFFTGGMDFLIVKMLVLIFILIWYIFSMYRIGILGWAQTAMFLVMIVIPIFLRLVYFASGHWSLDNITQHGGWFPMGWSGVGLGFALLTLKYIGFEMAPTFAEEARIPRKDFWKPVVLSLIIPAMLYSFITIGIAGMANWEEIASWKIPEVEVITKYNLPFILAILAVIAGLLHALTTWAGFWLSSARALYGFAEMGALPKAVMKTNRWGQPWVANTIILVISIYLTVLAPEQWLAFMYTISTAMIGVLYFIAMIDWWILRRRYPNSKHEFKVPAAPLMMVVGSLASLWIAYQSFVVMSIEAWIATIIYLAIGAVLWLIAMNYQKSGRWRPAISMEEIHRTLGGA